MQFSCDKSALCEAILHVSHAVAAKSTIVALEGILLKVKHQSLTLTGYNLELGIVKTLPVQSAEEGEMILQASLLSNIVNHMPDGMVTLHADQKLLTTITCQDVKFTVLGMSAEEYPQMPLVEGEKVFCVSADTFKGLISQTLFAVAQSDVVPIYTGTLFEIEQNALSVVSVDGYRMAMKRAMLLSDHQEEQEEYKFVVPGKTLNEILKLLSRLAGEEDAKPVTFRLSKRHIIFDVFGYQVISRLLEGDFLDYKTTIPKEKKTTLVVKTRSFLESLQRASIIINDHAKSPIRCEVKEEGLHLQCETTLGRIKDAIPVQMEGDALIIGFNHRYVADALKASECDQVKIEFNGPLQPIKIVPMEGEDFLFLVLPVRLKDSL